MEDLSHNPVFEILMYLKILRLFHIREVKESFVRVKEILSEIFILHRYMFDNLLQWTIAGTELLLSIHLSACGWIFVQQWKAKNDYKSAIFEEKGVFG